MEGWKLAAEATLASSLFDSAIFCDSYSSAEMRRIFSDEHRLECWMAVEVALARAQAELGLIPPAAAEEIARKASLEFVRPEAVKRRFDASAHVIVAFVRELAAQCERDAGEYLHWGTTTQDIIDSGAVLQFKEAHTVVVRELRELEGDLLVLAERHRETLMGGRTHGQHAQPITFGFKVAIWAREIRRHLERLEECRERLCTGQLAGAVGTLAGFGPQGFAMQRRALELLGLNVPDICWHSSRDRLAEFACILGMVAATLARIGNEVYELQKSEVDELEEPFAMGKVGSSTMPHKRNPFICESLATLARSVRYNTALMLEDMVGEHERDARGWKSEWIALPESCLMVGAMLLKARQLLAGLQVKPAHMRRNLDSQLGLPLSEAVMLALGEKIGRQRAHEVVYEAAMAAFESGRPLRELLLETPEVTSHLTPARIDELLRPERYWGLAPQIVDRVVAASRAGRAAQPATPTAVAGQG